MSPFISMQQRVQVVEHSHSLACKTAQINDIFLGSGHSGNHLTTAVGCACAFMFYSVSNMWSVPDYGGKGFYTPTRSGSVGAACCNS